MTRLPRISGHDCVKALGKAGFEMVRQRGSHMTLRRSLPYCVIPVPNQKVLGPGLLRAIIKQAGMTPDEFRKLLA